MIQSQEYQKDLMKLKDTALLESIKELAREERRVTLEILHHLREIERRRLFAARGFSSLFEYCMAELGYSESAAQRRISSMRLLKEIPELEEKIADGKLSLTVVSQAQSFFRKEAKVIRESRGSGSETASAPEFTPEMKREILEVLEGKSTREAEKELMKRSCSPEAHSSERVRPMGENLSELKFTLDQEAMKMLEQLRQVLGHRVPGAEYKQVIEYALRFTLGKLRPEPTLRKLKPETKKSLPAPQAARIRIPETNATQNTIETRTARRQPGAAVTRQVFQRDGSQCTFIDPLTRRQCSSRYQLEIDHIVPFALGGETEPENLRLLCRTHNQFMAARVFSSRVMGKYQKVT